MLTVNRKLQSLNVFPRSPWYHVRYATLQNPRGRSIRTIPRVPTIQTERMEGSAPVVVQGSGSVLTGFVELFLHPGIAWPRLALYVKSIGQAAIREWRLRLAKVQAKTPGSTADWQSVSVRAIDLSKPTTKN